jgi:hypothetical protein
MIREALIILFGCSDGATEHALKLQGVTMGTMSVLVRNGLARVDEQTIGVHSSNNKFVVKVDRYWITPKGKRTLEVA